jgi:phosphate starvation-inducible PhoH-like protein
VEVAGGELSALVGEQDANLRLIRQALAVEIVPRDGAIQVYGEHAAAESAAQVLAACLQAIRAGRTLTRRDVRSALDAVGSGRSDPAETLMAESIVVTHRGKPIRPRTPGQAHYVRALQESDLTLCAGPAGTGKTYLAMAVAIASLKAGEVSRLVLSRPVVEAGEALGFLPGDMLDKVEPYLRPLHDALHDIVGADRCRRLTDHGTIEVVPLAYMRGRTVNDAFMVLDEAQNCTPGQLKMFLTRMGFGSRMVVTGDITQSDLPAGRENGLRHGLRILAGVRGVASCRLQRGDIVRHDLVQRIVAAYSEAEAAQRGGDAAPEAAPPATGRGGNEASDAQDTEQ